MTHDFLEKPTDYIARTLALAAEKFALDDQLWSKTLKFTENITNNKQLCMTDKNKEKYTDALLGEVYNKYILQTMRDSLKENSFLAKAKIQI